MALKIFFGQLADAYIADSGRNTITVGRALGIQPNKFSKLKTGTWNYIAEKKLLRIIDEIAGRDRDKRSALMVAYLIDMTPEGFRPIIDIKPLAGADDDYTPAGMRLPKGVREKLEEIGRAYVRDKDFMRMADSLSEFARGINKRAAGKA
jgi:hypothetical protein